MFNKMKTEYMSWIFLIGIVLLFVELSFYDGGLLFSLAFSIGCMLIGKKYFSKVIGKIILIIGIITTLTTILHMMVFRFFLMAILVYLLLTLLSIEKKSAMDQTNFDRT